MKLDQIFTYMHKRAAISSICIIDNHILLVREGFVWKLLGGSPKKGESHYECLYRELGEKLPGAFMLIEGVYKDFVDFANSKNRLVEHKTFFVTIYGNITPSGEISDSGLFSWEQLLDMILSSTTRAIINSLVTDRYLK